jgi:DNA-binding response OmpR family regulator
MPKVLPMRGTTNLESTEPDPLQQGARLRVLVAEDQTDLSHMFTWTLSHCGFDAVAVLDGLEVHSKARSFRPHFILLDVGLPGIDGYRIAELIRKDADLNNVIIIGISAYGPDLHGGGNQHANFNHYLTKPVDIQSILPLLVPRQQ